MQLFSNMPRRDRILIAAAAFLYLAGQLCEILLDWPGIATESVALLMVAVGGVYVMALLYARHLS
jgi:ABC-type enterobactin transport system permease subunit